MKSFGYTLHNDRQIDFDATDKRLYGFVFQREPSINLCIFCGTCAATCSAGHFTTLSLRRISLLLRRGMNDIVKKEIEACMLCGKCQLACPKGVNTRNVILNIAKGIELYEL
jgi:heterodisulfide reductase subunit C